jgi:hypothetical protein
MRMMTKDPRSNGAVSRVTPTNPESPSALDKHPKWLRWGPYLAARQWGTVREDYSQYGNAWEFFPHDHARSRVYRWGEDGLLGISDDQGLLCFGLSLWNEADSILKERLFGLTGSEGNHGEDVKEAYYFLDNTPHHSYMKALYKYPQRAFPYGDLVAENGRRGRQDSEYELIDTGVFAENRYFDITVEYAKASPEDILIRISATNHGPDAAPLHLLPTLWFRNTWAWGRDDRRPGMHTLEEPDGHNYAHVHAHHWLLGDYWFAAEGQPELLFTENETNTERLWGVPSSSQYVKDGINDAIVNGARDRVNPEATGTKVAAHYHWEIAPGATETVHLRLSHQHHRQPFINADQTFAHRIDEADQVYAQLGGELLNEDERRVQRQAYAGLLWSKQFYYYDISHWLEGDPSGPPPPPGRDQGRNSQWRHLNNADVISMPDTWEYPWFAAWDLAFHCAAFAPIDPEFAKSQLILLMREWYMHPNGQVPAYEWAFGDVNPPVHAWATWQVYQTEQRMSGPGDRDFLERMFHKLLLNFTWWVNRKDGEGNNIFEGGFLGLDNIGVFDRSAPLPTGGFIEQSDGTAWMGMFSLNMMAIALELGRENPAYDDVATKFFEHFLYIAGAMNDVGGTGIDLWNEEDGFFYDVLKLPDGGKVPLKVMSLVGLIPMLAVETLDPDLHHTLPNFARRMRWFLNNRADLSSLVPSWEEPGVGKHRLLSLVPGDRLVRLLTRMLDTDFFLGPHGICSVSKSHEQNPYVFPVDGQVYSVDYEPAESRSGLFGGNSNWRGPVWFPINALLIEALRTFHRYYGERMQVECPTGSGIMLNLNEVADELARRLIGTFLEDESGRRPVYNGNSLIQEDPNWRDHILFYEYFHGDTGAGLGASHQTGWTALVGLLLTEMASSRAPVTQAGG